MRDKPLVFFAAATTMTYTKCWSIFHIGCGCFPVHESNTFDDRLGDFVESADDFWLYILSKILVRCGGFHGRRGGALPRDSTGGLDVEFHRGSLRCMKSTGLPGGLMHFFRFCFAAFNGRVCGAAAVVGFIFRQPQTSLAAVRQTLRATTGAVSREKLLSRKYTDAPHHTHWISPVLIWIVGDRVSECWRCAWPFWVKGFRCASVAHRRPLCFSGD